MTNPSRFSKLFVLALSLAWQLPLTTANNNNTSLDGNFPAEDIRGGYASPALSYYGVFQEFGSICGASLIYGDIALTAAHCVASGFPGSLRFNSQSRTSGGTTARVTSRTLHPSWSGSVISADLAILKLSSFLSLQPASINHNNGKPSVNGQLLHAAGFGLTSNNGGVSDTLQATTIPYREGCSNEMGSFDESRMICGDARSTATCGGDSGSPILLDGTNVQIGINSWSDGGCDDQRFDVYTRVSYYADWIDQQICQQSSQPPSNCADGPFPTPSPPTPSPTPSSVNRPAPTCIVTGRVGLRGALGNFFGL